METFENILNKFDWPKRAEGSNASFHDVEKICGFELPDDYKSFLQKFSGYDDFIGTKFVALWDLNEIIEANMDCRIIANLPNTIGIGTDGAGEFIGLEKITKNSCRVILSPLIDLDKQYHVTIGSSFTDFLIRLDNGQEWFKNGSI